LGKRRDYSIDSLTYSIDTEGTEDTEEEHRGVGTEELATERSSVSSA